jgi:LAO/AO transport system kinase
MSINIDELLNKARNWDKAAIAKLISLIEDGYDLNLKIARKTHVIGVTGPPGAGKSTLIYALARRLSEDKRVAILTVDPSSPFSGGSFMGNRIRMQDLTMKPNIYIRSMATRGNRGGLNYATVASLDLFEYVGVDYVFLETVGAGQTDTDVRHVADTILVLVPPLSGDEIQALKSGLMEIGDIYIASKSDNQASESVYRDLTAMAEVMSQVREGWRPMVLKVSGLYGIGIDDLIARLDERFKVLKDRRVLEETLRKRRVAEMRLHAHELLDGIIDENEDLVKSVMNGMKSPLVAAREVLGLGGVRLDHVAVAVKSAEDAVGKYRKLGFRVKGPVVVEGQGIKVYMVLLNNNARIELIEPLGPNTTASKFIEKRGEGLHHIALSVDDLESFIELAREAGLEVVGQPSVGAEGIVVFIHPRSLNGVLLELVQHDGH